MPALTLVAAVLFTIAILAVVAAVFIDLASAAWWAPAVVLVAPAVFLLLSLLEKENRHQLHWPQIHHHRSGS